MKTSGFTRTELLFSLALLLIITLVLFGSGRREKAEFAPTPPSGAAAATADPNSGSTSSPTTPVPRFGKRPVPFGGGAFDALAQRSQLARQVVNGKNVFTAMVNYAGTEDYPLYKDKEDPATIICDSSDALEILLRGGYLEDKKRCFNPDSAWCRTLPEDEASRKTVRVGENDWCYVVGLNRSTARSSWPILSNAFVPGTTYYTSDPAKKGGIWNGVKAIVVYCGGNSEIVETFDRGDGLHIVRRPDKPQQDAFVQEGEWLYGQDVKVLYPRGG